MNGWVDGWMDKWVDERKARRMGLTEEWLGGTSLDILRSNMPQPKILWPKPIPGTDK